MGDSSHKLAVLDYTPIGVKGIVCPWCYALRLPTANRRGAICGIRPESWLLDANCLDYGASLTGVWWVKDNKI